MSRLTNRLPGLPPAVRRFFEWFWSVAGAVSVRTKILGIVLALVLVLGVGVTLQVRSTVRTALSHELHNRGVSITRDVAARSVDMLLVHDLYGVHRLLQDTLTNNEDVRYAFIISPQGEILAHTFGDGFPLELVAVNVVDSADRYHLQKVATEEGVIWDFAVPIFDGRAGVARVGLSEQAMQTTLVNITRQLLVTTVLVSLTGVVAAMFLTWLITRPVLDLVDVTRAVARGDLSHKAPHWADDEIGLLSDSFNAMVEDLEAARTESEAYNAELLRRNRELAVLNAVAQAASRQYDLDEMLDAALHRVLNLMNMQAGWILVLEGSEARPRMACSVGLPASVARDEEQSGFPGCKCGRVLQEKKPLVITPLEETCPAYGLCLADNLVVNGHATVPLISKSQVLGTLNVACNGSECVSDEDLQLLGAIGRQLGVAVENSRLWEEVRQKEAARGQLLEKIITAQEEERKRIARELHDETGQALASLMVRSRNVEREIKDSETRHHLQELREVLAVTLDRVRHLAFDLRPSVLDDIGLLAALRRYAQEYQERFDTTVEVQSVGLDGQRLTPEVETSVYRIVQEAMINAAKYAGCTHISVLLQVRARQLLVIVEDNGCGFDARQILREEAGQSKLGLYGMQERAELIGGDLDIETHPGEGTTIYLRVPLPQPEAHEAGVT
ncbi:MAG: hypothetical protein Kow0063_39530 [Anaerolineae bacterium]